MKIKNLKEIGHFSSSVIYKIWAEKILTSHSLAHGIPRFPSPHIQVCALIRPRSLGEEKPRSQPSSAQPKRTRHAAAAMTSHDSMTASEST